MVVEVRGSWIMLHAGIAGGAHGIPILEIPFDIDKLAARVKEPRRLAVQAAPRKKFEELR
ncbi:hypothetical protein SAMN06265795_10937 [Noviherbaspirillum humi]|uniref:Uncharacterized protein n=1 Tax=Noviherbaspirillum humi TaxID=1688639 RepID=A0A239ID85_9BURK|nr:hypothetical protein SAMN06265795_10937 [Noviherbaspirillum humi]